MDRIKDSFARQGLMQTLGAELSAIAEGRVVITAPITPAASQQHGFAHAGMTFALGDSAAGYSALTLMPEGAEVLTAEMKINLLAPADGVRLIATGEVVKPGRKLVVVRATVETETADGTRKPVAILQGTMVPVIPKSG
ncbi:PaaI family thioesterase [Alterinioella nitratireducens]|uniref:PaaI family thioesterase n=1 Tax=Alterinioella nitratireducens TaxID=2735915 RepID=UPI001555386D|nr:PaaI family thioesterase [Alterinioella nitratireducens]NPD19497.1 PaaI family thioesterase [Alterinioella nitratireducens]